LSRWQKIILAQDDGSDPAAEVAKFVNRYKGVNSADEASVGAQDIIANKFVHSPADVVKVPQKVMVTVMELTWWGRGFRSL
jgi:transcriptional accessory protein Tex/SPT6